MDELSRYPIDKMPGQLNPATPFGQFLSIVSTFPVLKSFVEFGTWNGDGSTKSIMDGLVYRKDPTSFVSFEANKERHLVAKNKWETRHHGNVDLKLVHGKISNQIYSMDYIKNHAKYNPEFDMWYDLEIDQIADAPISTNDLPETIDFVLFDGGEFCTVGDVNYITTTYSPIVVAFDDVNSFKNFDNYHKFLGDPEWELLDKGGHPGKDGTSWAAFQRKQAT